MSALPAERALHEVISRRQRDLGEDEEVGIAAITG